MRLVFSIQYLSQGGQVSIKRETLIIYLRMNLLN